MRRRRQEDGEKKYKGSRRRKKINYLRKEIILNMTKNEKTERKKSVKNWK